MPPPDIIYLETAVSHIKHKSHKENQKFETKSQSPKRWCISPMLVFDFYVNSVPFVAQLLFLVTKESKASQNGKNIFAQRRKDAKKSKMIIEWNRLRLMRINIKSRTMSHEGTKPRSKIQERVFIFSLWLCGSVWKLVYFVINSCFGFLSAFASLREKFWIVCFQLIVRRSNDENPFTIMNAGQLC